MPGDKFAKTQAGRPLEISASTWNAMVDAARAHVARQHDQNTLEESPFRQGDIVKVRNQTGQSLDRFSMVGLDSPIIEPTTNEREFKNQVALVGKWPRTQHIGRFAILLEPLKSERIGRAWVSGVCPVQININESWHNYADIRADDPSSLESKPNGSAQILWREEGLGVKWAIVRLSNFHQSTYLIKVPNNGIPARDGGVTGSANCELYTVDAAGTIQAVTGVDNLIIKIDIAHTSTQPIRGPINVNQPQYLGVTFDGRETWFLDPPKQTLLCKPTHRIKSKSWGAARELRFKDGKWRPIGASVSVYNVCDYTLLSTQQIVCHFHEDTSSYLSIGCRCCDGSSSSSSSSTSSSSSSDSSSSSTSDSSSSGSSISSISSSGPSSSSSDRSSSSDYSSSSNSESESDSESSSRSSSSSSGSDSSGSSKSSDSSDSSDDSISSNSGSSSSNSYYASSSSGSECTTTWVWTCGWELVSTTCDVPGDPPAGSGSYDGQVLEIAA